MPKMILVNLPVTDLGKSTAFYKAMGFTKNDQFSDDRASGMSLSDTIFVMLLTRGRYRDFTSKTIPDAKTNAQMLLCVSMDDRDAVDAAVDRAVEAGGADDPTPQRDYGVMYGRSYEDPDRHIWEVMWMDPAAVQGTYKVDSN